MSKPVMKKSQVKLWFLIPFIIFLALMVMMFFRLGKSTEIIPSNALNKPVPEFSLPLLDERSLTDSAPVVSNADLPKQPYLINIWGSWCPTCKIEHPYLMQLKEEGVPIVGINYKDEPEEALTYLSERGDPFAINIQDLSGGFAIDLGLTGAPETFLVDKQGNIRQHIVGEINEQNWQDRILPCLQTLNNTTEQSKIAEVCV